MNSVVPTRLILCLFIGYSSCVLRSQESPAILAPQILSPPLIPRAPAAPPKITCAGNDLTIDSDGATMSEVMAALQKCVSLEVKLPPTLVDEPTYLHFGPGPMRAVIDAVLGSTGANYLLESTPGATTKFKAIQLTERTNEPTDARDSPSLPGSPVSTDMNMTPARRLWLGARSTGRTGADKIGDQDPSPADAASPETSLPIPIADARPKTETPVTTSLPEPTPSEQPAQSQSVPAPEPTTTSADSAPTAVLQKEITQMQQLFETRKKMIADANAASTHPPPADPAPN